MKKQIVLMLLAVVMASCSVSKAVQQSKKIIKGNWSLDNVTHNDPGNFKINLLGDASKECFSGSAWNFIPNNNTGTYNINSANCEAGVRHFIFTIQEIDSTTGLYDFLLKPTDERKKSITNAGFRLRLAQLSEFTMRWEQTVSLEGKPFVISMNFSKISD